MDIQVGKDTVFEFKLSAAVVQVLLQGLDELQHKVAKPVELLLMQQMQDQVK